jgi:hypothetical protein
VAQTAAQPEPGEDRVPEPPRRPSWRSGLGCGATLLSVAALVIVGQIAGVLVHQHRSDHPAAPEASRLAAVLDALPAAEQAVPATPAGVARLLAGLRLPSGTRTDTAFQPGDTVIAFGVTGDCVFVDVHLQRLYAWPAPMLAPCTATAAYQALLAQRRRPDTATSN